MKLSPESTVSIARKFADDTAEQLAERVQFETNIELSDSAFGELRNGLTDAVCDVLGRLEVR